MTVTYNNSTILKAIIGFICNVAKYSNNATPGRWVVYSGGGFISIGQPSYYKNDEVSQPEGIIPKKAGSIVSEESKKSPQTRNYKFIAYAREDIVKLNKALEYAVKKLAEQDENEDTLSKIMEILYHEGMQ